MLAQLIQMDTIGMSLEGPVSSFPCPLQKQLLSVSLAMGTEANETAQILEESAPSSWS